MLTPDNIWILGITEEPSTREYYLVFYHDIHALIDRFIQKHRHVDYMQYNDFYKLNEIGSGGYTTVYTAKYKYYLEDDMPQTVVLKLYKNFDETLGLFISEVSNLYSIIINVIFNLTRNLFNKQLRNHSKFTHHLFALDIYDG